MITKANATWFACLASLTLLSSVTAVAKETKSTVSLQSKRQAGQVDKVAVTMEFNGTLNEQTVAKKQDKKGDIRTPMSGVDRLTYYEKTLRAEDGKRRAARYYENAESRTKFQDGGHNVSLADGRRLIGVDVDGATATLFSPRGPLTRDELEVIDIAANSLLLDDLLPTQPVAVGDTWKPSEKTVAALLGLGGATACDVQCALRDVTDAVARVELLGNLEGTVNDTSTKIKLKAKYRFDRRAGRIDWFAIVTRERREPSQVASAFDVGVKLQMTITSAKTPELTAETLAGFDFEPTTEQCRLAYRSPEGRWRITYDRRWYLGSDDRDRALMKLMDQGVLVGQCNIASVADRDPDKLVSLEEFQEDVRHALGDNFGEFIEAKQSANAVGYRILRIVAHGAIHGKSKDAMPIRWVYYHIADRQGHQAALTFTIEQERLDSFADADRAIVASLRFGDAETIATASR